MQGEALIICVSKKLMNKFAKNVVYIPVPSFEHVWGSFNYLCF